MAAVSETIVREYFELHCFFVRQQRKFVAPTRRDEEEIDFFVINPRQPTTPSGLPFVLASTDVVRVAKAVVVVKGWHTETFSSARLANTPEIFRFLEPHIFEHAARTFGEDGPVLKILVVPALPAGKEAQAKSIELLRSKGVDAVILFRTLLQDLIEKTEPNRNYQKSDLLQIIRILKNYDFFRDRQMELFRPKQRRRAKKRTASEANDE